MSDPFTTAKLSSWDKLIGEIVRLSRGWAFRGQLARWELQTTIERYTPPGMRRSDSELRLMQEFKRRAGRYFEANQCPLDDLEWLASMQHFGAPTRLLDFTHSPYVAAYFAFENSDDDDRAIWAFKFGPFGEKAGQLLRGAIPEIDKTVKDLPVTSKHAEPIRNIWAALLASQRHNGISFESSVLTNKVPMVLPVEPFRLTERLTIQQGTFICSGDVNQSLLENLGAMQSTEETLLKLVIPANVRNRALEELRLMNITRASLFPGVEGFAQSFRQLLVEEAPEQRTLREALQRLRSARNLE